MHEFDDNVGGHDAAGRLALAVLASVQGFSLMATAPAWALFLGLPTILLGAYLTLTALFRIDPAYLFLGIDTVREHQPARTGAVGRPLAK